MFSKIFEKLVNKRLGLCQECQKLSGIREILPKIPMKMSGKLMHFYCLENKNNFFYCV